MNDDIQPHLAGEAPPGACSRWMGAAGCGAPAAVHVIWTPDTGDGVENSLCCPDHEAEARDRWVYVGMHPYQAECSNPAARWFAQVDRCMVPVCTCNATTEAAADASA